MQNATRGVLRRRLNGHASMWVAVVVADLARIRCKKLHRAPLVSFESAPLLYVFL